MIEIEDTELKKLARRIFNAVEIDLRDRRGIRQEWEQIDPQIQEEIRLTNRERIFGILKRSYGKPE